MSKFYIGNKLALDPNTMLQKVELTQAQYDALATKQDNILYVITDATNLLGEVENKLDQHLQNVTSGLNHVPSGGKDKQVLTWQADGKAYWETLSNILPGVENLLAYGVEWKDNVADPHLTRIGNMSLHKTLPIQSQLKGCIAQGNKIIYWLNENNWNYRKDPVYINEPLFEQKGTLQTTFNVASQTIECFVGQKVRIFDTIDEGTITEFTEGVDEGIISEITDGVAHITWNEGIFDVGGVVELGARLDGYDGTVRVYCPSFYIKSQIIGDTRRVWLSTVKIDNSWTYQPEVLIDAYRSTVLNTVPENMGYLSTLPVNSAISVVNTATYCRGGGNRTDYDKYLTGADGTIIDIFRTDLGKPRTAMSRQTIRNDARAVGSEMLSYNQYKNIFYWLYVVEYANFNSQEAYNATLTEDGYRQGGMGSAVTTMNGDHWSWYNGYCPLTPCGYCNEFGNGTGIKDMVITAPSAWDGSTTQTYTFQVPRWRGFDNPFGDIQTNLDGCIQNNYIFYVINDPQNYTDSMTDIATKADRAVEECHSSGHYYKEFNIGDSADIVPLEGSGSGNATTYKCGYHWTTSGGPHMLRVGGSAADGTLAGLGYFSSINGVSNSHTNIGFRTVSRSVSFS